MREQKLIIEKDARDRHYYSIIVGKTHIGTIRAKKITPSTLFPELARFLEIEDFVFNVDRVVIRKEVD